MNRRRMSGHRAGGGAVAPSSIRAPWSVYESGDGVSATGNGPTLPGSGWNIPAIIGDGLGSAGVAAAHGIAIGSDFSAGFYRQITANSLTTGEGAVAFFMELRDTRQLQVGVNNYDVQDTLRLFIYDFAGFAMLGFVDVEDVAIGIHHFALSVSSNSLQFFVDGVAVGSPTIIARGTQSVEDNFVIENSESFDGGYAAQFVFANVAYTAAEWAYIYNAGAGRAYEDWTIA